MTAMHADHWAPYDRAVVLEQRSTLGRPRLAIEIALGRPIIA